MHAILQTRLRRPARSSTSEVQAREWNQVVSAHTQLVWRTAAYLLEIIVAAKGTAPFSFAFSLTFSCEDIGGLASEVLKEAEDAMEVAIPSSVGPIIRSVRLVLASRNGNWRNSQWISALLIHMFRC